MSLKLGIVRAGGHRRAGGAGDCSAFPPDLRVKVAAAWDPLARVYQAFAGFQIQMAANALLISGPLAFITAPWIVLGVLLNVLPYIVVEVLINCNLGQQVQRQARIARENLDLVDRIPGGGLVPGLSDIKRAVALARPFLVAVERGSAPSVADVGALAQAAGVLDSVPGAEVAQLTGLVDAAGIRVPAAPSVSPWLTVAGAGGRVIVDRKRTALQQYLVGSPTFMPAAAAAAEAARRLPYPQAPGVPADLTREERIQLAKARAREEIMEKAAANKAAGITFADLVKQEQRKRAIEEAKARAREEITRKAKENAGKTMPEIIREEQQKKASLWRSPLVKTAGAAVVAVVAAKVVKALLR